MMLSDSETMVWLVGVLVLMLLSIIALKHTDVR